MDGWIALSSICLGGMNALRRDHSLGSLEVMTSDVRLHCHVSKTGGSKSKSLS